SQLSQRMARILWATADLAVLRRSPSIAQVDSMDTLSAEGRIEAESNRPALAVGCVTEHRGALCRMYATPRYAAARVSVCRLALAFLCLVFSSYYAFVIVPPAAALRG